MRGPYGAGATEFRRWLHKSGSRFQWALRMLWPVNLVMRVSCRCIIIPDLTLRPKSIESGFRLPTLPAAIWLWAVIHRRHKLLLETTSGNECSVEGRIMSSAAEYRELAEECLGWARTARSDRERRIFLQMAEAWLDAATRSEKNARPLAE